MFHVADMCPSRIRRVPTRKSLPFVGQQVRQFLGEICIHRRAEHLRLERPKLGVELVQVAVRIGFRHDEQRRRLLGQPFTDAADELVVDARILESPADRADRRTNHQTADRPAQQ